MNATLSDIADRTGCSPSTVSRVFNNSPLVNAQTRERVLTAIRATGYTPSHAARALKAQKTSLLGVMLPKVAGGFFADVLAGIDGEAAARGYHLMTVLTHGLEDEAATVRRLVRERRVDALVAFNMYLPDDVVGEAARRGMRIALIGRPHARVAAATVDNRSAAAAAMAHLLGHGYRDVAILAGPRGNRDSDERLAGCRIAAGKAKAPIAGGRIWHAQFTEESAVETVQAHLESGALLPRAIFALNDDMAIGARSVLLRRGLRIPEDVALMGFDGTWAARIADLSTVEVPMAELGKAAARAALDVGTERRIKPLPCRLVLRNSCGCEEDRI
ncbi:MAG TPA: LacI family DNA-binding transcriptional regulator [Kiritimatiellia bacterium]|jgi:LacI family transcriptional regulator